MNIRYETRNGRTYAYRSTSKRVPGKANPVSVKEYLGVVDPETGEIREKNARAKPRTLPPDGARIVDYGDALIVYKLAERSGLIGDLEHVFGDRAPFILAISLAQAVSPVSSDMIDSVLNSSYITEFVGLDGRMSFYKVREAINSIQNEEMNLFFRHRWERNPEKLYAYAHLMNDSEKSSSSKASISVLMILSQTGAPMGFSLIGDVSRDTTTLRNILLAIRNISECVFIADTEISQTLDISGLVMDGLDFAIPYSSKSDQFLSVESDYVNIDSAENRRMYGDDEYYLMEGRAGFLQVEGGQVFVPRSDPHFEECSRSFRTFLCFDPRMRAEAVESMKAELSDIRYRLDGHKFEDPERAFMDNSAHLSRFLRYKLNSNGAIVLSTRRRAVLDFNKNAGKTFVVLNSTDWDDVVHGRVIRSRISRVISQFNRDSRDLKLYVGRGVLTEPELFVEFLAILVRYELQKLLDEAGEDDIDADDALLIASTYKAAVVEGGIIRGSRDRRLARIFRILGVNDAGESES